MTATKPKIIEKPILFSGPMVRAILEGRKSQTRRVVKGVPSTIKFASLLAESDYQYRFTDFNGTSLDLRCPYGRPPIPLEPSDRLWVRETWGSGDLYYNSHETDPPRVVAYRADLSAIHWAANPPRPVGKIDIASWNWNCMKWRPSIFMPRWASRITLEVTDIRVERLQSISTEDIIAEGFSTTLREHDAVCHLEDQWRDGWNSINGKRPNCKWEDNPWVWVVEFRKLEAA